MVRLSSVTVCLVVASALPPPWITASASARPHDPALASSRAEPVSARRPRVRPPSHPLCFEDRREFGFVLRTKDADVRIGPTRTTVAHGDARAVFRIVGGSPAAALEGVDCLPGVVNYLVGRDRSKWRTNVPTFAGLRCRNVYPGIDAMYRIDGGQLAWDFVVAPAADASSIRVAVDGVESLAIDGDGGLIARDVAGTIRQRAPVAYQETPRGRTPVACRIVVRSDRSFGFTVGAHDAARPLVIDPTVEFTFTVGGNASVSTTDVATDSQGNTYLTGSTRASDFPVVGGIDGALGGPTDAFVSKVNAAGTALVYSTYLGGAQDDFASSIAVDLAGAVFLTGLTGTNQAGDFPVTSGAFQSQYGGSSDAFVVKLQPDGAALAYATYLGGSGIDGGYGIAVDASGNAYVTGGTTTGFPTRNAVQPQPGGGQDAFVAKLDASGSALAYSTYLGGTGLDVAFGIGLDPGGNAHVTGNTGSGNFATVRPVQAQLGGQIDAFVTVLSASGATRTFSTYLGGSENDFPAGIDVDPTGAAYVTGTTFSGNFPLEGAFQTAACGTAGHLCPDAFVSKIDPGTASLVYSSYLGGSDSDAATGIAVDGTGAAYVTGSTSSGDFPAADPLDLPRGKGVDLFVTRILPSGAAFDFSSAFGGSGTDIGISIAVDRVGSSAVVALTSNSADFPGAGGSTRPSGPERDFGGALGVEFGPRTSADVRTSTHVSVFDPSDGGPVRGQQFAEFTNEGPDRAEHVVLTLSLPCARLRSLTPSPQLQILRQPAVGEPITEIVLVRETSTPVDSGGSVFVDFEVLPLDCPDEIMLVGRSSVSASTPDPFLANNATGASAVIPGDVVIAPTLTWTSTPSADAPVSVQLFAVGSDQRPRADGSSGLSGHGCRDHWSAALAGTPLPAAPPILAGYRVYASSQPGVAPVPGNLFATVPADQTSADVAGAPAGSFFVVTSLFEGGTESGPSNEVGGTLPVITTVKVSTKKIVATGNGFPAGESVVLGGLDFVPAAKLKKGGTKLVQKGPLATGQTIAQFLQSLPSGSSLFVFFRDAKGNNVGYVYTR